MKLNLLDLAFLVILAPWVIKPLLFGRIMAGFSSLYVFVISAYFTFFWYSSQMVRNLVEKFVTGETALVLASIIVTFLAFFILVWIILFIVDLILNAVNIAYLPNIAAGILGFLAGIFFIFLIVFWLDSYQKVKSLDFWNNSFVVNKARNLDNKLELKHKLQNLNEGQKKIRSEFK